MKLSREMEHKMSIPKQRTVPNYLNVGPDENGNLLTLYFPNVMIWETRANGEVEITFQTGAVKVLIGAQAKKFAEVVGDREIETERIIVPDTLKHLTIQ